MSSLNRFVHSSLNGITRFQVSYFNKVSLETPGQRGLSHLAEHLMCKQFEHMNARITSNAIMRNASTGEAGVFFFFRGLTSRVISLIEDIFIGSNNENFFTYIPTKERFELERAVVLQEYDMYFSKTDYATDLNILRKHFGYYHAIGLRKDIEDVSYEDFIAFLMERFGKPDDVLLVSDDTYEVASLRRKIEANPHMTGNYFEPQYRKNHVIKADEDFTPEFYGSSSKETIIADWIDIPGLEAWKASFIGQLWGHGAASPIYNEIRKNRGLSYAPSASGLGANSSAIQVSINTDPSNVDDVRGILDDMFHNMWEEYITPERYDSIMDHMSAKMSVDNADNTSIGCISTQRLYGTEIMPSVDMIRTFSFDEVYNIHDLVISKKPFMLASGNEVISV
jgi:predicted Zn-dependent peptidase